MEDTGKLYIVATPIGHMDDITLRALKVLGEVSIVAAEDTRETGKLFARHNIKTRLISCHEHNERERAGDLISRLLKGESVALVSDAGTPSVSDPGYRLVRAAIDNGIAVTPIPGASACMAALCASGLPTDSFLFIGFPPKKKQKQSALIKRLANESATIVFYESPKRVIKLMESIQKAMGNREAVLSREITKRHEEFIRGNLREIISQLQQRTGVKGECTLLIKGNTGGEEMSMEDVRREIKSLLGKEGLGLKELSKKISKKYALSAKKVYEEALSLKELE